MKKIIFILLSIALFQAMAFRCAAQSEKCISPNWKEGEKYSFRFEGTTMEVNTAKDTSITASNTYNFYVSVIKAGKDGYKMRLEYPVSLYTSVIEDLDLSDIGDMIPIEYETDMDGAFVRITNAGFLTDFFERIVDAVIDLPQLSSLKDEEVSAIVESLKTILSPELVIQGFTKDIDILSWMYGIPLEENIKSYSWEFETDMNGVSIPATATVMFKTNGEGDNLYNVDMVVAYDDKSISPIVFQIFEKMKKLFQGKVRHGKKESSEDISMVKTSIVDYYHSVMSMETNRSIMSNFVRKAIIEIEDERHEKIQKHVIYALDN